MDDKRSQNGIEHGVFVAYLQMASLAFTTGKKRSCSYLKKDKERIDAMRNGICAISWSAPGYKVRPGQRDVG
jgi:hypothetical protein